MSPVPVPRNPPRRVTHPSAFGAAGLSRSSFPGAFRPRFSSGNLPSRTKQAIARARRCHAERLSSCQAPGSTVQLYIVQAIQSVPFRQASCCPDNVSHPRPNPTPERRRSRSSTIFSELKRQQQPKIVGELAPVAPVTPVACFVSSPPAATYSQPALARRGRYCTVPWERRRRPNLGKAGCELTTLHGER